MKRTMKDTVIIMWGRTYNELLKLGVAEYWIKEKLITNLVGNARRTWMDDLNRYENLLFGKETIIHPDISFKVLS